MAKKKNRKSQLSRRQIVRRERDIRQQRFMIWVAVTLGVIIVTLIIAGVVVETNKSRRPVARIDNTRITTSEFKARQYYERWMARLQIYSYQELLNQAQADAPVDDGAETPTSSADSAYIQQLQLSISNMENQLSEDMASLFASQVLDSMIEEELVRQEAASRGLQVNEEDVEATIEQFLGYGTSTGTVTDTVATPDPEDIKDTFNQFKTNVLEPSRFSEEDFRTMIRTGLLKEQLKAALSEDVDLEEDQVQVTLLTTSTEEEAEAIASRINDEGVTTDTIMTELNEDEDDNSYGYSVSWLPVGYIGTQISPDVERVAFNTPVGKASLPILGPGDVYFVIYVNGHEVRPLSEEILYQTQEQEYNDWLLEQTESRSEYLDWQDAVLTTP